MSKKEILTQQIIKFEESEKGLTDYRDLFVKVVNVTRQGSGLMWSDVDQCIKNAILEVELLKNEL